MKKYRKDRTETCDPCEERFGNGIREIVDEVEGYSPEEHVEKKEEVNAAFAGCDDRKG